MKTGRSTDRVPRKRRADALSGTDPRAKCPCTRCPHWDACADREIACTDFARWVADPDGPVNRFAALRRPDAPTYDRVFAQVDDLPEEMPEETPQ